MGLENLEQKLSGQKEVAISRQDLIDGLVLWLENQDIQSAARLYCRCSEDIGYALMSRVGKGPTADPLAQMFVAVKDFYKAAQVYEALGKTREAARSFEEAETYGSAAEMYGRLGEVAKSAEMLERAGDYRQAADFFARSERWSDAGRNYEKARETFLAGEAYLKGGMSKKALELLQKVEKESADYVQAAAYLGPLLEEMGFGELALGKYQDAIGDQGVDANTIAVFYALGCLYEHLSKLKEAQEIFAKILERDLGYQDVQERYRRLKEGEKPLPRPQSAVPAEKESAGPVVVVDQDRKFFEDCILFQDLTFDELRRVLAITESHQLKEKDVLLREGQPLPGIVLVRAGTLDVLIQAEGKTMRYARMQTGDHIGELTILGHRNANVSAVAATEAEVVVLPVDALQAFLQRNAGIRAKILTNTMKGLEQKILRVKEVVKMLWTKKPAPGGKKE